MATYDKLSLMQTSTLEIPEAYNVALLGGRGGGKSTAALLLALAHLKRYEDRAAVLVIRKTYKALADFEDEMLALVGAACDGFYSYNRQDKILRIAGSKIVLAAMEDKRSYDKLQGSNFTMLIVEEVTQHSGERLLRLLRSNLRAPEGVSTRVVYVGNPGGPLHARIYERHIADRTPWVPYELSLGDDTGGTEAWVTVPSTVNDNPFIDGQAYIRRLREACHGDPIRLKQWLYGDWEQGSGRMFSAWDEDVHLLEPPADFRVDKDVFRFTTSTDWGLSAPSVSLLGCVAKRPMEIRRGVICPRGSLWVIDEITDAIMDDPEDLSRSKEWTPGRLAERIVNRCADHGVPHPTGVVDDARGLRGESLIEEMRIEGFWSLTKPRKGRRAEGWGTVASMLTAAADRDLNRPHLYVSPKAKYLLATLPTAVRDEDDPDDLADTPSNPDHALDALRYLCTEARLFRPSGSGRITAGWY